MKYLVALVFLSFQVHGLDKIEVSNDMACRSTDNKIACEGTFFDQTPRTLEFNNLVDFSLYRNKVCAIDGKSIICLGSGTRRFDNTRDRGFTNPTKIIVGRNTLCIIDLIVKCFDEAGNFKKAMTNSLSLNNPTKLTYFSNGLNETNGEIICSLNSTKILCINHLNYTVPIKIKLPVHFISTEHFVIGPKLSCSSNGSGVRCWDNIKNKLIRIPKELRNINLKKLRVSGDGFCALADTMLYCWNKDGIEIPKMVKVNKISSIDDLITYKNIVCAKKGYKYFCLQRLGYKEMKFRPMSLESKVKNVYLSPYNLCAETKYKIQCTGDNFLYNDYQLSSKVGIKNIRFIKNSFCYLKDRQVVCENNHELKQLTKRLVNIDQFEVINNVFCYLSGNSFKCFSFNTRGNKVSLPDSSDEISAFLRQDDKLILTSISGTKTCWRRSGGGYGNYYLDNNCKSERIQNSESFTLGYNFNCFYSSNKLKCYKAVSDELVYDSTTIAHIDDITFNERYMVIIENEEVHTVRLDTNEFILSSSPRIHGIPSKIYTGYDYRETCIVSTEGELTCWGDYFGFNRIQNDFKEKPAMEL